eukprot:TRINITY_DN13039_c0_g1_i1.p2 TRINITY_DN13039_c0_g1~~TRINITY_DN13039_c0_g1_i1.p2  ORF type:complete len:51 (+),score=4.77 TRINITY_DN13039_c0_g1_i1:146-298(+)
MQIGASSLYDEQLDLLLIEGKMLQTVRNLKNHTLLSHLYSYQLSMLFVGR